MSTAAPPPVDPGYQPVPTVPPPEAQYQPEKYPEGQVVVNVQPQNAGEKMYPLLEPQQMAPGYQPVPSGPVPPPGAYSQPQQQPGQQPGVVMVAPQQQMKPPSFIVHIVLSCVVYWCCCCLLGLIAFILAMSAHNKKNVDARSARNLGYASLGVSIAGIVIAVIITIIAVAVYMAAYMGTKDERKILL